MNNFKVKLSWSFYDWANSAWSAMIITFVFSRYFVDVLAPDVKYWHIILDLDNWNF